MENRSSADQPLRSWRGLATTLQGIPPAGYLRIGLVLAAVVGLSLVVWQTRQALLPFFVGAIIAYILLPLVNALDRFMPRFLAVVIVMAALVGLLYLIIRLLIPPFVEQAPSFLSLIPDRNEIQAIVDQLHQAIQNLPPATQETVTKILQTVATNLRATLDASLGGIAGTLVVLLLGLFKSIGFVLGFLVVPAWLLNVLNSQRRGVRALNRVLPASIQKDFWAIAKIIDHPLRDYVGGQFLLALALGVGVYISFTILETLGWPTIRYKIPLAIWSTIFQLVPIIGPYIGALPAVLGGFLRSPLVGTEVIALYIFLNYAVNQLVGSRIGNRFAQIHPAILIIFIVAVSQLGFIWVLLTAPLISILVGLYRYLYGRLSDPPSPAGVLPDQPLPEVLAPQQPPVKRTPLAYRRIKQAQPPPGRT